MSKISLTSVSMLAMVAGFAGSAFGQNPTASAPQTVAAPAAPAPVTAAPPMDTESYPAVPPVDQAANPTIDPQAMVLLQQVRWKLKSTNSLSAEAYFLLRYPPDATHPKARHFGDYTTLRVMRPNYGFAEDGTLKRAGADAPWNHETAVITFASNGKKMWELENLDNSYQTLPNDLSGKTMRLGDAEMLSGFFDPSQSYVSQVQASEKTHRLLALKYVGARDWDGISYRVVEWSYVVDYPFDADEEKEAPGGKVAQTDDLFIGPDLLIHRIQSQYNIGWQNETYFQSLQVDPPMTASNFAFNLPAGAHPPVPPPSLLANGSAAPDFTVHDSSGNAVKLSDYLGKVVVLDFWATWCGPCQASLPHTNEVAEKYVSKNVVFLAVNVWDTPDAFQKWLPLNKKYDALTFLIDPSPESKDIASSLYKVSGIPTQYVIDKTGKVSASFVGYGGPTDDLENAIKAAGAVQ